MYLVHLTCLVDYKVPGMIVQLFAGSAIVSHIVMVVVAKHVTLVILELGGKCLAVVESDVNLQVTSSMDLVIYTSI